jgi:DNA mismatch repair ATPase MutS
VRTWLASAGEFEALGSLAAYGFERPDDILPDIVDEGASFVADALGHPLLPAARVVRNDVRLDADQRLLIVSGSNMSGKSTLLRTIGLNAVLARAGAPVMARGLRIGPLSIGATLRIQDSLQDGRSRFFAEITRLKAVVDLARLQPPALFLLDELFHGTNSHDRLVGAAGVLRALLGLGAVGLVTTHDMALASIVESLGPTAVNVHFEDRIEDGEMRFDYTMKPGPVTASNALALMRAVGLDVDDPS